MKVLRTTARCALAMLALSGVLALSGAGCSSGHGEEGCPELCERVAECPGASGGEEGCLETCDAETEAAEEAGCVDAHESYLECRNHAEDTCDPAQFEEECSIQLESLRSCLSRG
ncbi:hypothetical protein WMF31_04190 [Sorangium sp. So ce1036]|uniref:hypothetical protein n=1 Tax=Sorangium sp. So ce1036 TaxID=3133328 RepID=UPI003EFC17FA